MLDSELTQIERRNYLTYFEDGLADLAGGLVVATFGLGMITGSSLFFTFSWFPLMFFWPLKRIITYSRLGEVRFGAARRSRISMSATLLFIVGVLLLLVALLVFQGLSQGVVSAGDMMQRFGLLGIGAVMALPFLLVGLLFEIRRLMAYAFLVFAGWAAGYLFGFEPGYTVAAAGAITAAIGLSLLLRFIARYPAQGE